MALNHLDHGFIPVCICPVGQDGVCDDGDEWIPRVVGRHLCSGEGGCVDGSGDLCLLDIVSVLVQTAHGVEQVESCLDICSSRAFPVKTNQPHAGAGRDRVEDGPLVNRGGVVLQAECRDVRVARADEFREQVLIPDRDVGHRVGKVELFQDAADRERQALDLCSVKVCLLDDLASGHIHGFLLAGPESRAVSCVDFPEQGIASERQVVEVAVLVFGRLVADLDLLQVRGHGEVRKAHLQAGDIADRGDLSRGVNVDLRIVQSRDRAFQRGRSAGRTPLLDEIGTVFDRRIDRRVRRDGDVVLCVASELNDLIQRVARVVL